MPAEGISKGNDFCNDSAHETHESILFRHFSLFRVFRGRNRYELLDPGGVYGNLVRVSEIECILTVGSRVCGNRYSDSVKEQIPRLKPSE